MSEYASIMQDPCTKEILTACKRNTYFNNSSLPEQRPLMHTMKKQISEGKLQQLDSFEAATTS
jgi:hypothetical protein